MSPMFDGPWSKNPANPLRETCGNCWFQRDGSCHRRAPRPAVNSKHLMTIVDAVWPEVAQEDWCGDWHGGGGLISMNAQTKETAVHLVKPLVQSQGLSVSRLASGQYAISVHRGEREIVIDMTADECRSLVSQLTALIT